MHKPKEWKRAIPLGLCQVERLKIGITAKKAPLPVETVSTYLSAKARVSGFDRVCESHGKCVREV
jgi:hypothetical protein